MLKCVKMLTHLSCGKALFIPKDFMNILYNIFISIYISIYTIYIFSIDAVTWLQGLKQKSVTLIMMGCLLAVLDPLDCSVSLICTVTKKYNHFSNCIIRGDEKLLVESFCILLDEMVTSNPLLTHEENIV